MPKSNILVVEDNQVIAGMIRRFLTKSDYGITALVTTGEEAVDLAGNSRPDLVLMDVQLGGDMDGITAARLIWEKYHLPIVYLTGASDAETIARAASTEAYGYLLKPVQERDLVQTVEAAINKHQSESKLRESQSWLAATIECIADAVIGTDGAGGVKVLNTKAESITGWKQAEAVGKDHLDIFKILDSGTRQPAESAVVQVLRDKTASRSGSARILVGRDGAETTGKETASPIVDGAGKIIGVVLVFGN